MLPSIETLTPAQRALLHSALMFLKQNAKSSFSAAVITGSSPVYQEFYSFTQREIKQLMQLLFGNCIVNEEDFIKHFNDEYLSALNSNSNISLRLGFS